MKQNRRNDKMPKSEGELRGKFAEDQIVEKILEGDEAYDLLKAQLFQGAISRYNQQEQAALNDQRLFSQAAGVWLHSMLGKAAEGFPKAISDDVVSETISRNTANQEDTSKDTLDNMVSRVSQVEDMVTKSVNDLQSQMTDLMTTVAAALERIEMEAE